MLLLQWFVEKKIEKEIKNKFKIINAFYYSTFIFQKSIITNLISNYITKIIQFIFYFIPSLKLIKRHAKFCEKGIVYQYGQCWFFDFILLGINRLYITAYI